MAGLGIREIGRGAVVAAATWVLIAGTSTTARGQHLGGKIAGSTGGTGSSLSGAVAAGQAGGQAEKPGRNSLRPIGIIVDYPGNVVAPHGAGVAEAGGVALRPFRGIQQGNPSQGAGDLVEGEGVIVFRTHNRIQIEGREALVAGGEVASVGSLGELDLPGLGGLGSTSSSGTSSNVTVGGKGGSMLGGVSSSEPQGGGVGAFAGGVSQAAGFAEAADLGRSLTRLHPAQAAGQAGAMSERGAELLRPGYQPTLPTDPPAGSGQGGVLAVLTPSAQAGWTLDGSTTRDLAIKAPAGTHVVLFEAETGTILFRGLVHRPVVRPTDPPEILEVKLPNAAQSLNVSTLGMLAWID